MSRSLLRTVRGMLKATRDVIRGIRALPIRVRLYILSWYTAKLDLLDVDWDRDVLIGRFPQDVTRTVFLIFRSIDLNKSEPGFVRITRFRMPCIVRARCLIHVCAHPWAWARIAAGIMSTPHPAMLESLCIRGSGPLEKWSGASNDNQDVVYKYLPKPCENLRNLSLIHVHVTSGMLTHARCLDFSDVWLNGPVRAPLCTTLYMKSVVWWTEHGIAPDTFHVPAVRILGLGSVKRYCPEDMAFLGFVAPPNPHLLTHLWVRLPQYRDAHNADFAEFSALLSLNVEISPSGHIRLPRHTLQHLGIRLKLTEHGGARDCAHCGWMWRGSRDRGCHVHGRARSMRVFSNRDPPGGSSAHPAHGRVTLFDLDETVLLEFIRIRLRHADRFRVPKVKIHKCSGTVHLHKGTACLVEESPHLAVKRFE